MKIHKKDYPVSEQDKIYAFTTEINFSVMSMPYLRKVHEFIEDGKSKTFVTADDVLSYLILMAEQFGTPIRDEQDNIMIPVDVYLPSNYMDWIIEGSLHNDNIICKAEVKMVVFVPGTASKITSEITRVVTLYNSVYYAAKGVALELLPEPLLELLRAGGIILFKNVAFVDPTFPNSPWI